MQSNREWTEVWKGPADAHPGALPLLPRLRQAGCRSGRSPHPIGGAPELAEPARMVVVRQALDRVSRNAVGHSNDIHRHCAQTIRRRAAALSSAQSPAVPRMWRRDKIGHPRERSRNVCRDNSRGDHPCAYRDLPGTTGPLTVPRSRRGASEGPTARTRRRLRLSRSPASRTTQRLSCVWLAPQRRRLLAAASAASSACASAARVTADVDVPDVDVHAE
jgi:hypothetical protein